MKFARGSRRCSEAGVGYVLLTICRRRRAAAAFRPRDHAGICARGAAPRASEHRRWPTRQTRRRQGGRRGGPIGRSPAARRLKWSAMAPSAPSAARRSGMRRSTSPGCPASRCTSRKSWCCRRKAGTPLAEIEALVAASKQELAFEPMDYGPLLERAAGAAPSAAYIAANLSGPRRIKAGAARDHFLGCQRRVRPRRDLQVRRPRGQERHRLRLCKLLAGSWGTLAAMTDVTIKTLPRAETEATVLVLNLDDAARRQSHGGGHRLVRRRLGGGASAGNCRGAPRRNRLPHGGDGVPARRCDAIGRRSANRCWSSCWRRSARWATLDEAPSRALWRAIRDVTPFAAAGPAGRRDLWRISTAPTAGAEVGRRLAEQRRCGAALRLGRRADLGGFAGRERRPCAR